jgi:hypothetical protein
MAMADYITNRGGKIVGRTDSDKVYDRAGKLLGRYNKSENRTYDREGRYIGQGDKRVTLIKES